MAETIPEGLRNAIKAKLGKVTPRHVNRLIANIAAEELVSRKAAALLLARKLKINFTRFATKEDLAEMKGHTIAAATIEPERVAEPPIKLPGPKPVRTTKDNSLFVVHGRDKRLTEDMFAFLRAIGLNPMEWSQAVNHARGANPNVTDIVKGALKKVQGVIVLFSPDEEARLKKKFRGAGDSANLEGQARQNVTFEAGIALGAHHEKTLLVEVGSLRPISDIGGMHILRLTNSAASRKELASRLKNKLKFKVDTSGDSWLDVGNFNR